SDPRRLPPSYDPAMHPLGHPAPYAGGEMPAARGTGDYHEHARVPQPYPQYRPAPAADDARQPLAHPAYGHPHRPWSPHHRPQQHYVPAPPGHAPASDARYSPYNRIELGARNGRHHAPLPFPDHPPPRHHYPPHAGIHAGPHAPWHPGYPPMSTTTTTTPETPTAAVAADRPASLHSHHQHQPPLASDPRRRPDPAASPPRPEAIGGPPQRRIAVHSLLISDSSSSPEKPRQSQ
ncbi:hypothetical protein H4R21_003673, partial [Coemansia helicoidea]